MHGLSASWHDWLTLNISRGCTLEAMQTAMVKAGYEANHARALIDLYALQASRPELKHLTEQVVAKLPARQVEYKADPLPFALDHRIDLGDREATLVAHLERPQAVVFDGLLSDAECDAVTELGRARLVRSTAVDQLTGQDTVVANRTSDGGFFALGETPLIAQLEQRFARLMGVPLEHGEGLQLLRYGPGGEYRPHFDYFVPTDMGSTKHLQRGGQRTATLIVYLNEVERGGATAFPEAGFAVTPKKGRALYFRYMNARSHLDPLSLHAGLPVERGEKWIITKWVRERRYEEPRHG